jgi:L-cystine transport system permease protein
MGKVFLNIFSYAYQMLPYLGVTFQYVILSLFFGAILAFGIAYLKLKGNRILRALANAYTTLMRCIPSIVMLFLVYYIIPAFLKAWFGMELRSNDAIVYVILTFTLLLGGFLSETMRSAYQAVDRGQTEAAVSAGLTSFQAFYRITLPQAFYYSIPNLGNTVIYLFKEGALAFTIGLIDVMGRAYMLSAKTMGGDVFKIYIALALIYWPLAIILEQLFKRLEKKAGGVWS